MMDNIIPIDLRMTVTIVMVDKLIHPPKGVIQNCINYSNVLHCPAEAVEKGVVHYLRPKERRRKHAKNEVVSTSKE